MTPRITFRTLLFTLTAFLLFHQTKSLAQSAGAFMRMGIGARAGSMGDAHVAAASGPEAIYWNPAGLALSPSWQAALTQRRYSFERNFTFAGAMMPLGAHHALGLSWTGFRAGNLEARQGNTATPDAYFSDDENALALAWGYQVNSWLVAGVGAKFVHQNLFNESATGYSGALGLLFMPAPRLSFGVQWQDFLSSYRWSSGRKEKFPSTLMLGMALAITTRSLVTLDYHYASSQNLARPSAGAFRLGSEFRALNSLPVRIGYSQNAFTTGVGFEIPVAGALMKVDYNFAAQDGLNQDGHALSLGFEFGKAQRGAKKKRDSDFVFDEKPRAVSQARSFFNLTKNDSASSNSPNRESDNAIKLYIAASLAKSMVYFEPKTSSRSLGLLRPEARYEVVQQKGEWYQIKLTGKKLGWVKEKEVKRVVAMKR